MRIAAPTKKPHSGFVLMFLLAFLPVAAVLLYAVNSLQTASLEKKLKDRSREDLESLRSGVNYILRNSDLCTKAFYRNSETTPLKIKDNEKDGAFKIPLELDSIRLATETLLVRGSSYRSFTVDKITLSDRSLQEANSSQRYLRVERSSFNIRAHALNLRVELSQRSPTGRIKKATLRFDMNAFFKFDPTPSDLVCWTMAAPGFDSCAAVAGDSRNSNPTAAEGIATATCEAGSTLLTGGGLCLENENDVIGYYLDGTPVTAGLKTGYLTLNRAGLSIDPGPTPENSWLVRCNKLQADDTPGPLVKPSISMAVCCRNSTIDFPE